MSETVEEWRAVVGFESLYEVSNMGRVRSVARYVHKTKGLVWYGHGKMLKCGPHPKYGYPRVMLVKGTTRTFDVVHRLVAAAFIGPIPADKYVCHQNGVRNDNRVENLRIDTPKSNHADQLIHGTRLRGESRPKAKLTDDAVRYIRKSGESYLSMAKMFGVSPSLVGFVHKRQRWLHVSDEGNNV